MPGSTKSENTSYRRGNKASCRDRLISLPSKIKDRLLSRRTRSEPPTSIRSGLGSTIEATAIGPTTSTSVSGDTSPLTETRSDQPPVLPPLLGISMSEATDSPSGSTNEDISLRTASPQTTFDLESLDTHSSLPKIIIKRANSHQRVTFANGHDGRSTNLYLEHEDREYIQKNIIQNTTKKMAARVSQDGGDTRIDGGRVGGSLDLQRTSGRRGIHWRSFSPDLRGGS